VGQAILACHTLPTADRNVCPAAMTWFDETLDELARQPAIGYLAGGKTAAEPTALAALALVAHSRWSDAQKLTARLADMQQSSGAVAVRPGEDWPGWPTSLAICAWTATDRAQFRDPIDRGATWLLAHRGLALKDVRELGHNTELVGWAYAENTHSWVEPTAFAVLAFKAVGQADHPATREGIEVLRDRQLPGGGLNYGNTYVLGQLIRPHVQPTGIGLIALAGESDPSNRLAKSVAWLRRSIGPDTTPMSLAWALLGLRAHGVVMPPADEWLAAAAQQVRSRGGSSPHKLALLALAAKGWPA
jgi:hypothetical protein